MLSGTVKDFGKYKIFLPRLDSDFNYTAQSYGNARKKQDIVQLFKLDILYPNYSKGYIKRNNIIS